MDEIDKLAMGRRIKEIRKAAGLRQWQLAQILGTTQSAVHKYEHGVIPEPRRLIELARLGRTTTEWLLTGRHWENGSEEKDRMDEATFRLALSLRKFDEKDRRVVEDAMKILAEATAGIEKESGRPAEQMDVAEIATQLRAYNEGSRRVLAAALSVHRSVTRTVLAMQESRLATAAGRSEPPSSPAESGSDAPPAGERPSRRRQPA